MEQKKLAPTPQQTEYYRQQMMEMYRSVTPSAPIKSDNWLDSLYPTPHFERDRSAMVIADAPPPQTEPESPPTPPIAESPFVGYLRIFAFTGDEAEPISGARVVVTRENIVYANTETNRDGYTPVIPLPSVDPTLTLQPGTIQPYVAYNIQINAPGFTPVIHENVPIYGNNYVTQPVALLPLLPGADPDAMQDFVSGGPANL